MDLYDTSDYFNDHQLYNERNKKVLEKMKDWAHLGICGSTLQDVLDHGGD